MFNKRKDNRGSDAERPLDSRRELLYCSFCKKASADVAKLIAGPGVQICDECVEVCVEIIAGDANRLSPSPDTVEPRRAQAMRAALPQNTTACSLCGKPALSNEVLSIPERGVLCGDCADAIEDALAHGKPAT
jgi:hypothetical protein